jgi:hypothetical protein
MRFTPTLRACGAAGPFTSLLSRVRMRTDPPYANFVRSIWKQKLELPRMDIKEIVKDNEVRFAKYKQGFAYYTVRVSSEGFDYIFPVPLSDIGDATLLATDKAMMFMSYIRKALEEGTFVKAG